MYVKHFSIFFSTASFSCTRGVNNSNLSLNRETFLPCLPSVMYFNQQLETEYKLCIMH